MFFNPVKKKIYFIASANFSGRNLGETSNIKYLGIVIDHHLTWHDHIDYVSDKVRRCINIMTKVKRYLRKHCVISIYYSLVEIITIVHYHSLFLYKRRQLE